MNRSVSLSLALCALMLGTAVLTQAVTPTARMADQRARFDLASQVPASFAGWRVDPNVLPLQVDPDTQARLDKIYSQTLARTYINAAGQRVMLSIAYGGDQSDNMSVHKPEICYVAQGFEMRGIRSDVVRLGQADLPVRRLLAVAGARSEPITYWIAVGNSVPQPGMAQRMQELRYGLSGQIPDAMLVRVSSLDTDTAQAYAVQDQFIHALLAAMPAQDRVRLIGSFSG